MNSFFSFMIITIFTFKGFTSDATPNYAYVTIEIDRIIDHGMMDGDISSSQHKWQWHFKKPDYFLLINRVKLYGWQKDLAEESGLNSNSYSRELHRKRYHSKPPETLPILFAFVSEEEWSDDLIGKRPDEPIPLSSDIKNMYLTLKIDLNKTDVLCYSIGEEDILSTYQDTKKIWNIVNEECFNLGNILSEGSSGIFEFKFLNNSYVFTVISNNSLTEVKPPEIEGRIIITKVE